MKKLGMLLLIVVLGVSFCAVALADGEIAATGNGQVVLVPDMATINMGVTATNADVGRALTEVNENLNKVREALTQGGVAAGDIAVSDISMYTQYDYSQSADTIVGYTVTHLLTVTVRDTSKLGALIDSAISAGANQLNGVSLLASSNEDAYLQALALAVENARGHAQAIAQAAGLTLGEVKELKEAANGYGYRNTESVAFDAGAGSTQVDLGSMTVSAAVDMVFEAN